MIVALYRNRLKSQSKHLAISIREYLTQNNVEVVAEDDDAKIIGAKPLSEFPPDSIDFVITLGGDGTILRAVHFHPELKSPILGVNLGGLGFMADIPMTEVYPSLQNLLAGRYSIQERMMMEGTTHDGQSCMALNEIAFHRGKNASLVELAIHVDGTYLNTFSADGVIFSTPCGSTAYSLASGGPIVTPELEAFIITPICPHTISNRPIVLMPKSDIRIQYISQSKPIDVTFDGLKNFHLASGDVIQIQKAAKKARLVNLFHHDYFATLREKLGWTGKLKSDRLS